MRRVGGRAAPPAGRAGLAACRAAVPVVWVCGRGPTELLCPQGNFRHTETHNAVSREELMMVLAGLEQLHIRALFSQTSSAVSLRRVALEVAGEVGGGPPASNVELCMCPANYRGDSCQVRRRAWAPPALPTSPPPAGHCRPRCPAFLPRAGLTHLPPHCHLCPCPALCAHGFPGPFTAPSTRRPVHRGRGPLPTPRRPSLSRIPTCPLACSSEGLWDPVRRGVWVTRRWPQPMWQGCSAEPGCPRGFGGCDFTYGASQGRTPRGLRARSVLWPWGWPRFLS